MSRVFSLFLLLLLFVDIIHSDNLARGWGEHIDWQTLDQGKKRSAEENKPLMLIIHKSWCGACKALAPVFSGSEDVAKLAPQFVMVNVMDDEEPKGREFVPDGEYIPRILFLEPSGLIRTDLYNEGRQQYKYFYSQASEVAAGMKRALEKILTSNESKDEL